jgi:cell division protein FtsA
MLTHESRINLADEPDIPIPHSQNDEKEEGIVTLSLKKSKKEDEAGVFSKFWNWATQLF